MSSSAEVVPEHPVPAALAPVDALLSGVRDAALWSLSDPEVAGGTGAAYRTVTRAADPAARPGG